ncbi:MAG: DUF2270 domain-containing protein, partial [Rhodanobacteraceae bacterium]
MADDVHPNATPAEAAAHAATGLYDAGYVAALSHFYRGELGRIMVWRTRLDTTINWAVT